MTLYINSCVRNDSRTDRLAKALLKNIGEYTELKLNEMDLQPLNTESLERRTELINAGNYDDSMFELSKQFAAADEIVISAPFWDGSFPSILKIYLENIYVTGIVSKYGPDGRPCGLCKAKKLYYVTTAGGPYFPQYSYEYIKALATSMFGIEECQLVYAENMDIVGNDPEEILKAAIEGI